MPLRTFIRMITPQKCGVRTCAAVLFFNSLYIVYSGMQEKVTLNYIRQRRRLG